MLVLVTGASGHIGRRLLRALEGRGGWRVRCVGRPDAIAASDPSTEIVSADGADEASLDRALEGVHTAFYLVQLPSATSGLAARDHEAAAKFGRAAGRAGVRRIVYLDGLAAGGESLSEPHASRAETARLLRAGGAPVVELHAAIVIGEGSLSFEIARALVERLPVIVCPRWIDTPTQPIAADDVVAYLLAALDLPAGRSFAFEIGGPSVASYADLLRTYARLRGLRRQVVSLPVLAPRLSGWWLSLVASVQARDGRALVERLRRPSVVKYALARATFPVVPMPIEAAIQRTIADPVTARQSPPARALDVDAPAARVSAGHGARP